MGPDVEGSVTFLNRNKPPAQGGLTPPDINSPDWPFPSASANSNNQPTKGKSMFEGLFEDSGDSTKSVRNTPSREFVRYALRIGALELVPEGRKLKSGRISPYFFNSGLFNTGDSLSRLAGAYAATVYRDGNCPDVIFGPAYKGIPLVSAVAVTLGNSIGYAFDRKEEKDHGEGGIIVGSSLAGKTVTILDDVMTTGKSIIDAAEIICKNGGIPIGCVIAFDREERVVGELSAVQEFTQKHHIPVHAAATLDDLIWVLNDQLENDDQLDDHAQFVLDMMLAKIRGYKAEYGVAS